MCLIVFAIGASKHWPLVIASNRDEFLARPTQPLARWHTPDGNEIISGRDLRAGGTWLGVTPTGRVAFLTNVREPVIEPARNSRGHLVTRWLDGKHQTANFVEALEKENRTYAGFNLVIGDLQTSEWVWMTNKSSNASIGLDVERLQSGIYGLSNAGLDTPWPKSTQLKRVLTAALFESEISQTKEMDALRAPLWHALTDRARAAPAELPATGVPLAAEKALSSAFVDFPEQGYGTRSSTLLIASTEKSNGKNRRVKIDVSERTYLHRNPEDPNCIDGLSSEEFDVEMPLATSS